MVEDRGDAALFVEWGQREWDCLQEGCRHAPLSSATGHPHLTLAPDALLSQKVEQIAIMDVRTGAENMEFGGADAELALQLGFPDLIVFEAGCDFSDQDVTIFKHGVALAYLIEWSN